MIVNRLQVKPDELWFSYVVRLSVADCVPLDMFARRFLGFKCKSFDIRRGFIRFCRNLGLKDTDMAEHYLSLSIFPFEALFMTEGEQTKYVCGLLDVPGISAKTGLFDKLRFCPCCMVEDRSRYGEVYAHRVHQLNGVKVCYKHGKSLLECDFVDSVQLSLDELANNGHFIDVRQEDVVTEHEYACFTKVLLASCWNADIVVLKSICFSKMAELGYGDYVKSSFQKDFERSKYNCLMDGNVVRFRRMFSDVDTICPKNLIALIMFLYDGRVDLFEADLDRVISSRKNDVQKEFINVSSDIKCLSVRDTVIKMYYDCSNGRIFFMTDWGMVNGLASVVHISGINTKEFCFKLIELTGNGKYEIVSDYEGFGKALKMRHADCGCLCNISPAGFIFREVRCSCEKKLPFYIVAERIAKAGRFMLKEYNGINYKAVILHEDCGKSFECYVGNFLVSPYCRACAEVMDTSFFRERLKDVLGSEYAVSSEYEGLEKPVYVEHIPCGRIMGYHAKRYLLGHGCRYCKDKEKRQKLHDGKGTTDSDKLYLHMKETYGKDSLVFVSEVHFEGWSKDKIRNTLRVLFVAKKIVHAFSGCFVFDNCEKHYTVDDAIFQKYVNRRGKVMGYLAVRCFCNITESEKSPRRMVTALEKSKVWRLVDYEGYRLFLRRPRPGLELDERNVLFLPVLDKLSLNQRCSPEEMAAMKAYLTEKGIGLDDIKSCLEYYPHYVKDRFFEVFRII